jgi:NADPH:quinone reductase-like Zn-dependent oxidoreductase
VRAARIHQFGLPEVIVIDDVPCPTPGQGEVIVRVAAAGVGPWDALIRGGKTAVNSPLPLILGAELSGAVTVTGPDVSEFEPGDEVYGATNKQFYGAYAEYALALTATLARKPYGLTHVEAASVPVVGVTAWQMLFDYGRVQSGGTILIHGAAGNVGAYVVQLASQAGLHVFATASSRDREYVTSLGAVSVVDYKMTRFEEAVPPLDVVIDTVGGETRERSYAALKPDGILVSVVTPFPESGQHPGVREAFFIVDVTTARLNAIGALFNQGKLTTQVGTVLPLCQARTAHEMLGGAPHKRGKIVLTVAG